MRVDETGRVLGNGGSGDNERNTTGLGGPLNFSGSPSNPLETPRGDQVNDVKGVMAPAAAAVVVSAAQAAQQVIEGNQS